MSEGESRAADYLGHIVQAIERIESYTAGLTERAFLESGITQDAVIRNFEVNDLPPLGAADRNGLPSDESSVQRTTKPGPRLGRRPGPITSEHGP